MTDTQPPRHSARDIAVKSNGYTYMCHPMTTPTCVVKIYSWHIRTCSITGSICCWDGKWARDVRTIRMSCCKLFNNFFKLLNLGNCYALYITHVKQYLHSAVIVHYLWDVIVLQDKWDIVLLLLFASNSFSNKRIL